MSGKFQQKIPVLLEKKNYYFRINEKQQNHNLVLQNIYIYQKAISRCEGKATCNINITSSEINDNYISKSVISSSLSCVK